MVDKFNKLFDSEKGREVYNTFLETIKNGRMSSMINSGVLLGFSGGADSVMLLACLLEYRKTQDFKILLCHVNHNIRGEEAERDENFCKALAKTLNLELKVRSVDVPAMARDLGKGLEETARDVRYSEFKKILRGRTDINAICLAHNSTDNLETVIFNTVRGTGLRGLCGIPPVRDNIIRPLINLSSKDIRAALDNLGVEYVFDSTNLSVEYSRNYIRHKVIPLLYELNGSVEKNVTGMCSSLVCDRDFIEARAEEVIGTGKNGVFDFDLLLSLDRSVFSSFFSLFAKRFLGVSFSREGINSAYSLIHSGNNSFRMSLPGGAVFLCEQGKCVFLGSDKIAKKKAAKIPLTMGENDIDGYNATVILENSSESDKNSLNVYKITTEAKIPSAIIKGDMYLRFREDGDTYRWGGMSRKLKKVFNDRNIPPYERDNIPIICDGEGILWVAGLPVRDYPKEFKGGEYITVRIAAREARGEERSLRIAKTEK